MILSLLRSARRRSQFFLLLSLILGIVLAFVVSSFSPVVAKINRTEILWDTWGVPHIYAKDIEDVFRAFGWAQMQSHGNLISRLYGAARGRGAEYWGKDYLESDRIVRTMGFPDNAPKWYEAQSPNFRRYLDAFVAGMNAYVETHPEQIADEVKVVLPLDVTDVTAHLQGLLFRFLSLTGGCNQAFNAGSVAAGSNGWAIAPKYSASGKPMLLVNPHLNWSGEETFYEAQLNAPGFDAYGAALVGSPVLNFAFNDYLSWTHTVNTIDACDLYELQEADGGYSFDGQVRAFKTQTQTLKVKQEDGSLRDEELVVRRSIHGPVVEKDGKGIAIRVVGVDQFPTYGVLEQWWDMARAKNLTEFDSALQRLQISILNVVYADRDGHIMYLFNGQVPVRSQGDFAFWQGIVPGNTSLWTEIHPYRDLPKIIDPPSGWVQNSNDPPWSATFPQQLNPNDFPPYIAPRGPVSFRAQRGVRMLTKSNPISFEQMTEDKYSTRMELADRILDDLIAVARQYGSETARTAADVLQAWDRQADADSRGAVLFWFWVQELNLSNIFATPWDENNPLITPKGIADPRAAATALDTAANKIQSVFGNLYVPWGDIVRLRRGEVDLPGNGGPGELGIFRVIQPSPAKDERFEPVFGDSYIAAVEFSNPVRAMVLTTYGNSTQPDSPHLGDQLVLAARKELRSAWRSRQEIEANLESRQVF
jgi:acyl-homoserine-lactone acylase